MEIIDRVSGYELGELVTTRERARELFGWGSWLGEAPLPFRLLKAPRIKIVAPRDMKISFNDWLLKLAHNGTPTLLAEKWVTKRGRLTRDSVEKRALELGFHPGVGAAAWDTYQSQVLAAPPPETQPQPESKETP